ncbi:spectinomycin phosphotransferase [Cupriavidus gilardii J11]|uniref:Spectinomycin phosphotransferase n=1 Tax=Cupriavidus gilardii J11 TaxID=936133 RepID=A0A562BQ31_9BURK|nr:spectinomycin phosphotransferase [Cupriavidus gilardii J11]
MLIAPPIPLDTIAEGLMEGYGLRATDIVFLPRGGDPDAAAYRVVDACGDVFFLKLRAAQPRAESTGIPDYLRTRMGLSSVMAPLRTMDRRISVSRHNQEWLLFPFVAGQDGFARALSAAQWRQLGQTLARLHCARLPEQWRDALPRDSFAAGRRDDVRRHHAKVLHGAMKGDAIVGDFAALWNAQREAIALAIQWAAALADRIKAMHLPLVPCHADLHAGNVIVGDDGAISIVDWDTVIMAPRERDCMFIGAGVGGVWNRREEHDWFFEGYGDTALCEDAIRYYRFQRIVTDLAEFVDIVCARNAGDADRLQAVQWMGEMFAPGNVFECALRGAAAVRCPG